MSDEDTKSADNSAVDQAIHKFSEALSEHKNMTVGELNKLKIEMEKTLHEAQEADRAERRQLAEKVERVAKWVDDKEKADAEHGKVKESSTTIVVPPDDVVPAAPAEHEQPVHHESEGEGRRGGKWRNIW